MDQVEMPRTFLVRTIKAEPFDCTPVGEDRDDRITLDAFEDHSSYSLSESMIRRGETDCEEASDRMRLKRTTTSIIVYPEDVKRCRPTSPNPEHVKRCRPTPPIPEHVKRCRPTSPIPEDVKRCRPTSPLGIIIKQRTETPDPEQTNAEAALSSPTKRRAAADTAEDAPSAETPVIVKQRAYSPPVYSSDDPEQPPAAHVQKSTAHAHNPSAHARGPRFRYTSPHRLLPNKHAASGRTSPTATSSAFSPPDAHPRHSPPDTTERRWEADVADGHRPWPLELCTRRCCSSPEISSRLSSQSTDSHDSSGSAGSACNEKLFRPYQRVAAAAAGSHDYYRPADEPPPPPPHDDCEQCRMQYAYACAPPCCGSPLSPYHHSTPPEADVCACPQCVVNREFLRREYAHRSPTTATTTTRHAYHDAANAPPTRPRGRNTAGVRKHGADTSTRKAAAASNHAAVPPNSNHHFEPSTATAERSKRVSRMAKLDESLFLREAEALLPPGGVHGEGGGGVTGANRSRVIANLLERRRVAELNNAFDTLRTSVPNYGNEDRSLSKIKTLRYAMTYMVHLMALLEHVNQSSPVVSDVVVNSDAPDVKCDVNVTSLRRVDLKKLHDDDPLFKNCQEHLRKRKIIT